jgi:hypothetical protein
MRNSRSWTRNLGLVVLWMSLSPWISTATAAEDPSFKTAAGLSVSIGIVPAALTKGPPSHNPVPEMHGGVPHGRHAYHIMAAIFDSATGARISDATVTAQVSGLGLYGPTLTLEPMDIAGAIAYGNFFNLPGRDLYTIRLEVQRPGANRPTVFNFKYDHSSTWR